MVSGNPRRTVKPNLVAGTAIRGGIVVVGAILLTAIFVWTSDIPSVFVLAGGILLGLTGLGLVYFNLESREYRFYENEVEVFEGFLNIKQNNTSYDRVTDISYSQPIIQRLFGTGTVKLNTAGSGYHEIKISYLDNLEKEYETLKKIVEERG